MPTIAEAIVGDGRWGWLPVAVLITVVLMLAFIAAATARETAGVPLDELGDDAAQALHPASARP